MTPLARRRSPDLAETIDRWSPGEAILAAAGGDIRSRAFLGSETGTQHVALSSLCGKPLSPASVQLLTISIQHLPHCQPKVARIAHKNRVYFLLAIGLVEKLQQYCAIDVVILHGEFWGHAVGSGAVQVAVLLKLMQAEVLCPIGRPLDCDLLRRSLHAAVGQIVVQRAETVPTVNRIVRQMQRSFLHDRKRRTKLTLAPRDLDALMSS